MVLKIIRGTIVGILLGACAGMVIVMAMCLQRGMPNVENLLRRIMDTEAREAFVEDTAGTYGLDDYDDALRNPQDIVVRFHVRANSNSEADMQVKYKVRDAVLSAIGQDLQDVESDSEALLYLSQNLEKIRSTARSAVGDAGYCYDVKAYITTEQFPIREYGELVMPAGTYRALRIDIGEAKGENFWCMLYPMMCYTVDAGAVADSEGNDKLEQALSEEEYEKLFVKRECKKGEVKVKFRLVEWLQDSF